MSVARLERSDAEEREHDETNNVERSNGMNEALRQVPGLTVRGLRTHTVKIRLDRPLETSGGEVYEAPLVLIDLLTEEGVTGRTYLYCHAPFALEPMANLVLGLEDLIKGDIVAPIAINRKFHRMCRVFLGSRGLMGMAIAGIDMAAWDALAKAAGMPLAVFLGGEAKSIPAYCTLRAMDPEAATEEAREMIELGVRTFKLKVGYRDVEADVEAIRAFRSAIGEPVRLAVDYNQKLSVPEALRRVRVLDEENLYWIEEPTLADDFEGHARIVLEAATPIRAGENWWSPRDAARSIKVEACDYGMPDVMKIGGVTAWLRVAALAESAGLPLSSHIFPEVSAHLLAVTPTAHLLEYLDFAGPILRQPLKIENGYASVPCGPGTGIEWDEDAVKRYSAG